MGETFYSVLGVDADADEETIRQSYRDLVKEHHPDVSDDPAAPDQFTRLTTARDVLLDASERARYDRLGHDTYVRRHVDASVWKTETGDRASSDRHHTTGSSESKTGNRRRKADARWSTRQSGTDARQSGRNGTDSRRSSAGSGSRQRTRRQGGGERAGGDTATAGHRHRRAARERRTAGGNWQRASTVYDRVETNGVGDRTISQRVLAGVRAVGPWLGVHFVFILSALATGWFTFTQARRTYELSITSVTAAVLVFGLVIFLSVIHVISQLYS